MTDKIMDYKERYEKALDDMRAIYPNLKGDAKLAVEHAFPELKESEDERIRNEIIDHLVKEVGLYPGEDRKEHRWLRWLEKQKETHYTKRNALFDKCVAECDPAVMKEVSDEIDEMLGKEQKPQGVYVDCTEHPEWYGMPPKEQKPASTEDMPYITDEHFYEREPVDSFKYKLAEYMTRGCTKKEGPYGYEYGISAETILEMAKEELLKRGVVQKPVEWSNEDEEALREVKLNFELNHEDMTPALVACYERFFKKVKEIRPQAKQEWDDDDYVCFSEIVSLIGQHYRGENIERGNELINWLKGYEPQPSWKPSEEQMNALNALNCHGDLSYVGQQNQLISLYNDLKKLM